MVIQRKPTREVNIGEVTIGGRHPIAVQSMIVEDTADIDGCVSSIIDLHRAGCEIVRVTTPNVTDAGNLGKIRTKLNLKGFGRIPLVADIHHNGLKVAEAVTPFVDKIRLNPGLFVFKRRHPDQDFSAREIEEEREKIHAHLRRVIATCRKGGTSIRIGVNHGSLSERMLFLYGDTPLGMVESALEFVDMCEREGFRELVISLKASRVPVMVEANRLLFERFDARDQAYPSHLGVTEAGDGMYARIKSTAGLAPLLLDGIGDTIRVSLAEDPLHEIPVCYDILQSMGLRRTKAELIACPSCGRTKFNLREIVPQVRAATQHLVGLNIAVMGCIVNGPGEMADADYGYVGMGINRVSLYRGRQEVKRNIPQERGIAELLALIKADGLWVEPPEPVRE